MRRGCGGDLPQRNEGTGRYLHVDGIERRLPRISPIGADLGAAAAARQEKGARSQEPGSRSADWWPAFSDERWTETLGEDRGLRRWARIRARLRARRFEPQRTPRNTKDIYSTNLPSRLAAPAASGFRHAASTVASTIAATEKRRRFEPQRKRMYTKDIYVTDLPRGTQGDTEDTYHGSTARAQTNVPIGDTYPGASAHFGSHAATVRRPFPRPICRGRHGDQDRRTKTS